MDSADEQKRRSDTLHIDQIHHLLKAYQQNLKENKSHYEETIETSLTATQEQVNEFEEEEKEKENYIRTVTFDTAQRNKDFMEKIENTNLSKNAWTTQLRS